MTFASIAEIREANKSLGHHWFDPDAMEAFGTTIESEVIGGRYFVTGEQDRGLFSDLYASAAVIVGCDPADAAVGLANGGQRRFTVREASAHGAICTVGEFGQYDTRDDAISAARAEA